MNNPLDHDFEGFKFSAETKIYNKDNAVDLLQNFGGHVNTQNLLDGSTIEALNCEICVKQFSSKKELRNHILTHLGKPRVLLKRVTNLKVYKRKQNDTYWLDPDKKSPLKLTLKKQSFSDPLKLTLKKSSESKDFAIVNNKFNSITEKTSERKVAETKENDHRTCKEAKSSVEQPFENVMVDQQDDYETVKFDTEDRNPLEGNEKLSLDANEGDSGVGSDMANPPEKEDQNEDDSQGTDQYDNHEKRLSETDDHEESDALEVTYRETIENLKKLGEQSSVRSNQLINNATIEEDEGTDRTNMIQDLEENSAISIISKASTFSNQNADCTSMCENIENPENSSESPASFTWNQLSTDLTNKNNETLKEDEQPTENVSTENNVESAGSLLQNFLIEHQRRNQGEASLSENLSPVETEYVSLEKLAETVNTCRVCNEKFKDITHLDEHRSKTGHFQCNIPECATMIFNSPLEVSMHKSQVHGTPLSPGVNQLSPHLNTNSPHLNQNSPHLNQASPQLNTHSPHAVSTDSPTTPSSQQHGRNSPLTSPHQNNSPTFGATSSNTNQQQTMIPPVNFEQLPAPVQQLAQQVQRMPLPQTQMPSSLPPGANTMIPGPNYFVQPPGRPPLYRVPGPQGMHYPAHIAHLYSQYGPYPQMTAPPPQMHPQLSQQLPRGRYPSSIVQTSRTPRIPQTGCASRQRMKRPIQQTLQAQQQNSSALKQRRMDVLLPDRNEDADCHVIAQQKRNDGLPVIQNVQGATTQQTTSRNDSTIHLTDSITLSVRQPGSTPTQVQNASGPANKKSDAKAVANVLAARGITVTPAANKNKTSEQNKQQIPLQQQRPTPSQQPLNVTALNLNSAISIIPASSQRKQQDQQGQFAVPQNKQNKSSANNDVERPPRPPTVDLTQDGPPQMPVVRRGRPPRALLTCQVCDKSFQNQEILTQHMATHRAPSKLLHKCNLCPAQYPTVQALSTHRMTYHKEVDTVAQNGGAELALPVVDLKSPHVLNRLSSLGIQSYIPLSQLSAQTGGYFGLPIITIDGARNPNACNLGALGATSILSLGPLKQLSNRHYQPWKRRTSRQESSSGQRKYRLFTSLFKAQAGMSNTNSLASSAEQYFHSINPLAQRIGEDITATKEAYEGLWNTLTTAERNQAINETIIQPEVALKYTLKKVEVTKDLPEWYPKLRIQTGMKYVIDETGSTLRWRDEHSAPFSFMTQSQMNLNLIDSNEDSKSRSLRTHFGESPHFMSPINIQRGNQNSLNDNYGVSHTVGHYQSECFTTDIFENEQCDSLLTNDIDNGPSESIFVKLINKTSLLKLQNNVEDDLESLVRGRDLEDRKLQTNVSVVASRTKSIDINESTALLETPSSYSSFQSSHLNQEEEERSIPKTGFEFLDNW